MSDSGTNAAIFICAVFIVLVIGYSTLTLANMIEDLGDKLDKLNKPTSPPFDKTPVEQSRPPES